MVVHSNRRRRMAGTEMKNFNWNKAELKTMCLSEDTGGKSVAGEVAQICLMCSTKQGDTRV